MAQDLRVTGRNGLTPLPSDASLASSQSPDKPIDADQNALLEEGSQPAQQYQLYRRRFFGLAQLTLIIFIVHLDAGVYGAVTEYAAAHFNVSYKSINWLGIAFSFAFVPPCPLAIWAINKGGPQRGMVIASVLLIIGNWIRYAGTATKSYGVVMFGHILIAFSNPFVLPAPTRYSQLWFSSKGRTSATGICSLASATGSAICAAVANPMLKHLGMNNYVLVITIISTVACIPSPFIPKAPPTPPSAAAAATKLDLWQTARLLSRNKPFYIMFTSFSVFVAAFSASSTIISMAIIPYREYFTQTNASLAVFFMVIFGVVAAAIVSPILDRTGTHLISVKCMTPVIASSYLALAFILQTKSVAGLYVVFALIGASSFAITPGTLEFQAAWTFPASPEVSSVFCWMGGQILTGVFVLVMQNLVLTKPGWGQPAHSEFRGFIFQAIIAWAVVPLTLVTGYGIFKRPAGALREK